MSDSSSSAQPWEDYTPLAEAAIAAFLGFERLPAAVADLQLAVIEYAKVLEKQTRQGNLTSRSIEGFSETWDKAPESMIQSLPVAARQIVLKYAYRPDIIQNALNAESA